MIMKCYSNKIDPTTKSPPSPKKSLQILFDHFSTQSDGNKNVGITSVAIEPIKYQYLIF